MGTYCNDRRLVKDDALVANVDKRVGRAEIYRQVVGEQSPLKFLMTVQEYLFTEEI